jgi:Ca2+-binding RTX toxin-like protein
MLAQAQAAGSIPWHFIDPTTGNPLTVTANPQLWTDPRAGPQYGGTPLTQPVPTAAATGWTVDDSAHSPDLSYLQYLTTGSEYYLAQLNAEASAIPLQYNPGYRGASKGLFTTSEQVRGMAWDLRTLVEAAAVNPDGSAEKTYFTGLVNNNLAALLAMTKTANEGQMSGWFNGVNGDGTNTAPWQQDYMVTSLALAAANGFAVAKQLLAWQTNFIAGAFLNASNGFSPWDGAAYELKVIDPATGKPYQTWSAVWQATQAAGNTNPNPGTWQDQNYVNSTRAALACIITVNNAPQAVQAFGWLSANQGATSFTAAYQADPTFDIAPRLSDGVLLTQDHIFIRNDSGATAVTGTMADELIYERGSGNVTINGTGGVNMLFGGAGVTTLNGGGGDDFLFAGSGATTLYGAGGSNYLQAGSGAATTFALSPTDVGTDMVAKFRIGTDHLRVAGEAPGSAALLRLLAGATTDASGNTVLHLAASHNVTLQGVATAQLASNGVFV